MNNPLTSTSIFIHVIIHSIHILPRPCVKCRSTSRTPNNIYSKLMVHKLKTNFVRPCQRNLNIQQHRAILVYVDIEGLIVGWQTFTEEGKREEYKVCRNNGCHHQFIMFTVQLSSFSNSIFISIFSHSHQFVHNWQLTTSTSSSYKWPMNYFLAGQSTHSLPKGTANWQKSRNVAARLSECGKCIWYSNRWCWHRDFTRPKAESPREIPAPTLPRKISDAFITQEVSCIYSMMFKIITRKNARN